MFSLRFLFFVALAVACVFAEEQVRDKKDVVVGAYPYAYSAYHAGAYVPTAYSGYAYPAAYSAYPYNTGFYRSGFYY